MNKFIWSTSSVAFQVEGGRSKLNRKPSIWDKYTKENFHIPKPGSTEREVNSIENAADLISRFEQDAKIMKNAGMNGFVYGVDWSRVIEGPNKINLEGLGFYIDMFKTFYENDVPIIPVLFHWDTPLWLEELGGMSSRIALEHFSFFVKVMYKAVGSYSKIWYSTNETSSFAFSGYLDDYFPPGKKSMQEFINAVHILNLCNAVAKKEFKIAKSKGWIDDDALLGLIHDWSPAKSFRGSIDDMATAEYNKIFMDVFLSPNFLGTYPNSYLKFIEDTKDLEFEIQKSDMELLSQNKLDLIGWNYYRPAYVADPSIDLTKYQWKKDAETFNKNKYLNVYPIGAKYTKWNWLIDPGMIIPGLKALADKYPRIPIMITENGYGDLEDQSDDYVRDIDRINYLKIHIDEVLKAKEMYNINVIGYSLWTYCDVFSPSAGYRKKYGIVRIDFENEFKRSPKLSYLWFKKVISQNNTNIDLSELDKELSKELNLEIFNK